MNFTTKANPDTWRKLQKLEAGSQTQLSTLVEEAFKVYNNQDLVEVTDRLTNQWAKDANSTLQCKTSRVFLSMFNNEFRIYFKYIVWQQSFFHSIFLQYFIMKIFKHTEKLREFYSEH